MKKSIVLGLLLLALFGFTKNEIKWVAIGDSITYLNDHLDETDYRVKSGYMSRVIKKLTKINYINHGYNGWTACRVAEKIDELGIQQAEVYTVFLGTNDWWAGKPLGSFSDYENSKGYNTIYGAFRIIRDKIKSLNPEARVVLITPMKRVDFVYVANYSNNAYGSYQKKNDQDLEEISEAIIRIGQEEGFEVLDLYHHSKLDFESLVKFKKIRNPESGEYQNYAYPDFIGLPFDPKKDEYPYPPEAINMTYDGLHPSDKGNELIAKELVRILRK